MRRWLFGLVAGTALAWGSSNFFVRSYSMRVHDAERGRWVRPAGTRFRWPLEGYGVTHYGATGLPGWQPAGRDGEESSEDVLVALYGDSQAEGLCVSDRQKLHRQLSQSLGRTRVIPLAESGDTWRDWADQFAWAEKRWGVKLHVILLTEISDVMDRDSVPNARTTKPPSAFRGALLKRLPDMAVHAVAGLALDPSSGTRRSLRFRPGPVKCETSPTDASASRNPSHRFAAIVDELAGQASKPIVVVYAPRIPSNTGKDLVWEEPLQSPFPLFADEARKQGLTVIDARPVLVESAKVGRFPHGFHHGQLGNGHLNAVGYDVLANLVSEPVRLILERPE